RVDRLVKIRIELECLAQHLYTFVVLPESYVLPSQMLVCRWRERIKLDPTFAFNQSFFRPTHHFQIVRVIMARHRRVGVQLDGAPKLTLSAFPVPIVPKPHQAHHRMGLEKFIVCLKSTERRRPRFCGCLTRPDCG